MPRFVLFATIKSSYSLKTTILLSIIIMTMLTRRRKLHALKSSPLVVARLHSVHNAPPNSKIIHLLRHAQGTHNICPVPDYKYPQHIDARLTPTGMDQCRLARDATNNLEVECIISSSMTRALQTARYSFEGAIAMSASSSDGNRSCNDGSSENSHSMKRRKRDTKNYILSSRDNNFGSTVVKNAATTAIPVIASEHWRETVNYLCDMRRPKRSLQKDFPHVDFSLLEHEKDPLWEKYARQYGPRHKYTDHRESIDEFALQERARAAWTLVAQRPERSIAIVSHRAFFRHMFERMEGQVLVFSDPEVKELLQTPFSNCELRTIAMEPLT